MRSSFFLKLQALSLAAVVSTTAMIAQTAAVATSARPAVRITKKVDNAVRTSLAGTHPAVVDHGIIGARLSSSKLLPHLRLVLTSSPDQEAALQQLMGEQQDKTSANYHKWLTPETFGTYFGPAQADIAKVTAWLADQGMSVDGVSKSGRVITFSGNVGQVESAFTTKINAVQVNGVAHFTNTTDLSIPSALAPVVAGVARVNDLFPTRTPGKMSTVQLQIAADGTATGTPLNGPAYNGGTSTKYVAPGDAAAIYNTTPLTGAASPIDGTGVTVAVLAQSNVDIADVQKFRSMFGLPKNDPTITIVGSDPGENQDDVEAFLDIEWAGAMAPKASVNFLVSQPTLENGGIDAAAQYAVENNIGDIISLSYGGCETSNGASGTAFWNSLWEQAASQGQTVFVSSGDSGAAGCDASTNSYSTNGYGVNALGSSAYNVAIGGSIFIDWNPTQYWGPANSGITIPFSSALSYVPEGAVNQGRLTNDELNAASSAYVTGSGIFSDGGGISIYTARPSWQTGSGIPTTTDAINVYSGTGIAAGSPITGLHRLVPDLVNISANGHDGTLFCAGSVCSTTAAGGLTNAGIVGGTSVATPVQAGMQALIDQKNGGRQGNILPILYALANAQYTASTTACQAVIGTTTTSTPTPPASTCNFHDVIAGTNVVPTAGVGTAGIGFTAGVGYDEATGLGSMNVANVANNWASISLVPTTTTFTLSPTAGITHGATQNLTVAVAPTTGMGTPTGDISLIASTTSPGGPRQYTLTSGAFSGTVSSATLQYDTYGDLINTALPAGNYNVYVHYAGDGTYAPSNSAPVPVSIAKEASTTTISPYNVTTAGAVNPATSFAYGSSVYLDTYVNPASGKGIPTGTVTYTLTQNGTSLASLTTTLDPSGNTFLLAAQSFVSFYLKANYTALSPGAYVVTATYSGDTTYSTSTTTTSFTIAQLAPTVTFTAPVEIASGGTAVFAYKIATLNTSANPNTAVLATGTVAFTDTTSATVLGTCTLASGSCSFSTTGITTAGANTIQALYSGDVNYSTATNTATVTVGTLTTATLTLATSGTVTVGGTFSLKATMSPTAATGTVSFFDGTTYVGACTLSNGTCSYATGAAATGGSPIVAGSHSFSATYSGSTTYASATGTLTSTVAQNTTSLSYFSVPANSSYGQPVTFSITIVRSPTTSVAALVPPTGVVNFYIDGGTTPVAVSGQPAFDPAGYGYYFAAGTAYNIPGGSHTVTATYVGDANFKTSSNTTGLPLAVATITPTINLTTSTGATVYSTGSTVYLQALIPASSSTLAAPSSTVIFTDLTTTATYNGPAPTYNATLGGFISTLALSGLSGTHAYSVSLAADTNYAAATSNTLTVLVLKNDVWVANGNGTVSGLTESGAAVTTSGVAGGGTAIAIDNAGDVWSLNKSGSAVAEYSSTGTLISAGSTIAGLSAPSALAIDGSGFIWVANGNGTLSALTSTGTAVSPTAGYKVSASTPTSISIDSSGNLWITNSGDNSVTEVFGAATPVTTPTTNAVKSNTLAAKP